MVNQREANQKTICEDCGKKFIRGYKNKFLKCKSCQHHFRRNNKLLHKQTKQTIHI